MISDYLFLQNLSKIHPQKYLPIKINSLKALSQKKKTQKYMLIYVLNFGKNGAFKSETSTN